MKQLVLSAFPLSFLFPSPLPLTLLLSSVCIQISTWGSATLWSQIKILCSNPVLIPLTLHPFQQKCAAYGGFLHYTHPLDFPTDDCTQKTSEAAHVWPCSWSMDMDTTIWLRCTEAEVQSLWPLDTVVVNKNRASRRSNTVCAREESTVTGYFCLLPSPLLVQGQNKI